MSTTNNNLKNLIGWWKIKGEQERDPFIKFFIFYVCLDAYLTFNSNASSDKEKLEWLLSNNNCWKNKWNDIQSTVTKSWILELKNLSPITDMRPDRGFTQISIKDETNFSEIIYFIYQIRCNLFHGSKSPQDSKDAQLVELAANIMQKWVVWSVHSC